MIQKPHRVNFNFTLNWIFPQSPAAKENFPRVLEYTFPTEFPARLHAGSIKGIGLFLAAHLTATAFFPSFF
jgi:hypothetical protein